MTAMKGVCSGSGMSMIAQCRVGAALIPAQVSSQQALVYHNGRSLVTKGTRDIQQHFV